MSSRKTPPEAEKRYLEAINVGSQTIPAYGACEIVNVTQVRANLVIYQVQRPTAYDLRHVAFNSRLPIAVNKYGRVTMDWPAFATADATPSVGDVLGTTEDGFDLTANSSGFRVVGIQDAVIRVTFDGSLRKYRGTLNENMSSNEADGDLLLMDGTDTGRDVTFTDPAAIYGNLLTNTQAIYAYEQDGVFYIDQAGCP